MNEVAGAILYIAFLVLVCFMLASMLIDLSGIRIEGDSDIVVRIFIFIMYAFCCFSVWIVFFSDVIQI